jgi:hypothetical protein
MENVIKAIRAIYEKEMGFKKGIEFYSIPKTALCQFIHEATISAELMVKNS